MPTETFTIRVDSKVKKRLEKIAKTTGRSRSFLAAEALAGYVELNEWQIKGVKEAQASMRRGEGIPGEEVERWMQSLGTEHELPRPTRRR